MQRPDIVTDMSLLPDSRKFVKLYLANGQRPDTATEFSTVGATYKGRTDYMDSEVGKGAWHDCTHYAKRSVAEPGMTEFVYDVYDGNLYYYWNIGVKTHQCAAFGPYDSPTVGLPELWQPVTREPSVSSTLINTLKDRSLDAMLPGIRPKLSLVNSLIELKDMRSLGRSLSQVQVVINRARRVWNNSVPLRHLYASRRPLRELVHMVSDLGLQEQFNFAPLVSDICDIKTALRRISGQVKHLLANEGGVERRHYQVPLDPTQYVDKTETGSPVTGPTVAYYYYNSPTPSGYLSGSITGANCQIKRVTNYSKALFHATIEYSYSLHQYEREHAALYGLLDAFGVNFNPAIIWNAIPWSFVVDWVFGVSRWLNNYRIRLLEPQVTILRYCWSVDIRRTITTSVKTLPHSWYPGTGDVPMFSIYERAYKRRVDSPDISGSLARSGISLHEFILGSALAASRWR